MTGNRVLMVLVVIVIGCAPKEQIRFRSVRNMVLEATLDGVPLLHGEAVFYNPNRLKMKLKEVKIEVFIDDEKSAETDKKYDLKIPAYDEFTIPIELRLTMRKEGLLGAVFNLLQGKKYTVHYLGHIRVHVHGVTVKIPIDYTDQLKVKI